MGSYRVSTHQAAACDEIPAAYRLECNAGAGSNSFDILDRFSPQERHMASQIHYLKAGIALIFAVFPKVPSKEMQVVGVCHAVRTTLGLVQRIIGRDSLRTSYQD